MPRAIYQHHARRRNPARGASKPLPSKGKRMSLRNFSFIRTLALTATLAAPTAVTAQGFGAVYTLSNDAAGNTVDVSLRLPSGRLLPFADYATGGDGTGAGLGSQGAIAQTRNGRFILAVNAGSDEVAVFRTFFNVFLWRTDTVSSGGDQPTSVAVSGRLVYVLNAGSDEVTGFRLRRSGLEAIPGATYPLSQSGAAGAQVGFSPNGEWLVVSERATNTLTVFPVEPGGTLGAAQHNTSAGDTPFGFQFRNDGLLVVSEAFGGAPGASVTSSYRIMPNGQLMTITGAAATNQTAACWIAIPRNGRFAYTTNTASGTLSGYSIMGGQLNLLDPSGVTGDLGAAARPIDADFDRSGRYLFVLDSGGDEIATFRRSPNGGLTLRTGAITLPDGAAGLIAR